MKSSESHVANREGSFNCALKNELRLHHQHKVNKYTSLKANIEQKWVEKSELICTEIGSRRYIDQPRQQTTWSTVRSERYKE